MQPPSVTGTELTEATERRFPTLTPMQEAFATNYVLNGGNGTRAAKAAGYAKGSAHVEASKMLRKAPILEAIRELLVSLQTVDVVEAHAATLHLMRHSKSDYVRLEAAKDVKSRAGFEAPKRFHVGGSVSISIDLGE